MGIADRLELVMHPIGNHRLPTSASGFGSLSVFQGRSVIPAGADPFDIPGVALSHHDGHCSFHAFLRKYKLKDRVLERIARIVDEADTIQEVSVEPAAAGLDLLCEGLRLVSPDDDTALKHGTLIYDALYARLASE